MPNFCAIFSGYKVGGRKWMIKYEEKENKEEICGWMK